MAESRATASAEPPPGTLAAALPCRLKGPGRECVGQGVDPWRPEALPTEAPGLVGQEDRAVVCQILSMASSQRQGLRTQAAGAHLKVLQAAGHVGGGARQLSKLRRMLPQALPCLGRRRHAGRGAARGGVPPRRLPRPLVLQQPQEVLRVGRLLAPRGAPAAGWCCRRQAGKGLMSGSAAVQNGGRLDGLPRSHAGTASQTFGRPSKVQGAQAVQLSMAVPCRSASHAVLRPAASRALAFFARPLSDMPTLRLLL